MNENQLILDNTGLINHIVKRFKPKNNNEYEEYLQCGRIGLLKAIRNHNPERGRLTTIAWKCIRNEILSYINRQKKQNKKLLVQSQIENFVEPINYEKPIYYDRYEHDYLTEKQIKILHLKEEGFSLKEIGEKLKCSPQSIFLSYSRALRLIKKNEKENIVHRGS